MLRVAARHSGRGCLEESLLHSRNGTREVGLRNKAPAFAPRSTERRRVAAEPDCLTPKSRDRPVPPSSGNRPGLLMIDRQFAPPTPRFYDRSQEYTSSLYTRPANGRPSGCAERSSPLRSHTSPQIALVPSSLQRAVASSSYCSPAAMPVGALSSRCRPSALATTSETGFEGRG